MSNYESVHPHAVLYIQPISYGSSTIGVQHVVSSGIYTMYSETALTSALVVECGGMLLMMSSSMILGNGSVSATFNNVSLSFGDLAYGIMAFELINISHVQLIDVLVERAPALLYAQVMTGGYLSLNNVIGDNLGCGVGDVQGLMMIYGVYYVVNIVMS